MALAHVFEFPRPIDEGIGVVSEIGGNQGAQQRRLAGRCGCSSNRRDVSVARPVRRLRVVSRRRTVSIAFRLRHVPSRTCSRTATRTCRQHQHQSDARRVHVVPGRSHSEGGGWRRRPDGVVVVCKHSAQPELLEPSSQQQRHFRSVCTADSRTWFAHEQHGVGDEHDERSRSAENRSLRKPRSEIDTEARCCVRKPVICWLSVSGMNFGSQNRTPMGQMPARQPTPQQPPPTRAPMGGGMGARPQAAQSSWLAAPSAKTNPKTTATPAAAFPSSNKPNYSSVIGERSDRGLHRPHGLRQPHILTNGLNQHF